MPPLFEPCHRCFSHAVVSITVSYGRIRCIVVSLRDPWELMVGGGSCCLASSPASERRSTASEEEEEYSVRGGIQRPSAAVQYSTVQSTVQYSTVQYSTEQYRALQHEARWSTAQHSRVEGIAEIAQYLPDQVLATSHSTYLKSTKKTKQKLKKKNSSF